MIPISLKLVDFLSHRQSIIDFDELDPVTLIVGVCQDDPSLSNGAGKSSIFDAITWALYEKSRASGSKSVSLDSVVRQGTTKAEVEFVFRIDNDLYRVTRIRDSKKRQSDVRFQIKSGSKWQSIAADTKKQTNQQIINTIGIDYDIFVNSTLLEQGAATAFANMTAGERKDVVAKILQLDHYDQYVAQAKEKLAALDIDLRSSDEFIKQYEGIDEVKAAAEQALKSNSEQIEVKKKAVAAKEKVVDKIRNQLAAEQSSIDSYNQLIDRKKQLQDRVATITNRMQGSAKRTKDYADKIADLETQLQQYKERVLELKEASKDRHTLKRDWESSQERYKEIKEAVTSLVVETETAQGQLTQLQQELNRVTNLDTGQCPTCYADVTPQGKQNVAQELQSKIDIVNDKLGKAKVKLQKAQDAQQEVEQKIAALDVKREEFNRTQEEGKALVDKIKVGRAQLEEYTQSLKDAQSGKSEYKEELATAQEQLATCLEQLDKVNSLKPEKVQELRADLTVKNRQLEEERELMMDMQGQIGRLQNKIEQADQVIEQVKQKIEARKDKESQRRVYKELIRAFGKQGIQALIMENSAIEIEKIANSLLDRITDGRVKITIETQKENKDGSLKEVFDVIITDEHHSSPFVMYSGGEKFRIAFVIRIALSTLLARRSGVKVSAIFYDEAFQDLDRNGIDRLIDVFTTLAQDFKHQLVVTHQSDLKSQFSDVLVVQKGKDGSTISKS